MAILLAKNNAPTSEETVALAPAGKLPQVARLQEYQKSSRESDLSGEKRPVSNAYLDAKRLTPGGVRELALGTMGAPAKGVVASLSTKPLAHSV